MRRLALLLAMMTGAHGAAAHPHIFVEAEIEIMMGESGPEALRLTWTYDEFFSLLITGDLGLDEDADGELTARELATLSQMVLDWPEGFEGDFYVSRNGNPITIGQRRDHQARFENGHMIESMVYALPDMAGAPLVLRVYDPFYYTAYTVTDVQFSGGTGCRAQIARADLIAATERVDELLYAMPQDQAEVEFPAVGVDFADEITLTCGG